MKLLDPDHLKTTYYLCGCDADGLNNVSRSQSVVYEWVEDAEGQGHFKDIQSIEVVGARDWTHFAVDSYHFLVVASARSESSTSSSSSVQLQYSVIYLWQSGRFIPFQTIEVRHFLFTRSPATTTLSLFSFSLLSIPLSL